MKKIQAIVLSAALLFGANKAIAFNVVFDQLSYVKGNTVRVSFTDVSQAIGVENGIRNGGVSEMLPVSNSTQKISLGTISNYGQYPLEFHYNGEVKKYVITVLPDQGNNSPQFVQEVSRVNNGPSTPLFQKFLNFITVPRMIDNLDETIQSYLADNPVTVSTTIILCGSSIGFPVLYPACISGSKDIALGFTVELMKNVVDDMPIPSAEKKSLKNLFSTLSLAWSLSLSSDKVDRIVDGLSYLTEITDNETLLSKLGFDQINNFKMMIRLK